MLKIKARVCMVLQYSCSKNCLQYYKYCFIGCDITVSIFSNKLNLPSHSLTLKTTDSWFTWHWVTDVLAWASGAASHSYCAPAVLNILFYSIVPGQSIGWEFFKCFCIYFFFLYIALSLVHMIMNLFWKMTSSWNRVQSSIVLRTCSLLVLLKYGAGQNDRLFQRKRKVSFTYAVNWPVL